MKRPSIGVGVVQECFLRPKNAVRLPSETDQVESAATLSVKAAAKLIAHGESL